MIERDEGESPSNLLPTSPVYPHLIAGQVSSAAISALLLVLTHLTPGLFLGRIHGRPLKS